jgi:hypothetical protein
LRDDPKKDSAQDFFTKAELKELAENGKSPLSPEVWDFIQKAGKARKKKSIFLFGR